jgi:CRP/FNR family transcriptional regulator, cyclic AMP receptor protein
MAIKRLPSFNPKSFLAKVGEGRSIGSYDKEQIIFFTGRSCSDGRDDDGIRHRPIGKTAIARVIHQEPAFSEMFIAHLLGRTIRIEADLVDQLFNSSEKRLARLLLLLANFGKEDKPEPLIAKISQGTLVGMEGTTRSRVSFFMNKFRKLGFIHYNGGIQVHSSLLNVVLHDEPHIET